MNSLRSDKIEEVMGEYGPIHLNEIFLQKIWLAGSFSSDKLLTTKLNTVEIIQRGTWNKLEGPDFKNAIIRLDGELLEGDIEIHFKENDWFAHGHDNNPEYNRVILHVVLFPNKTRDEIKVKTTKLPTLILLPLLHYDLESYLNNEIYHDKSDGILNEIIKELKYENKDQVFKYLLENAQFRWLKKCEKFRKLIAKEGSIQTLHIAFLECLGFRRNQDTMRELARMYEFQNAIQCFDSLQAYDQMRDKWNLRGVRPANQPKLRLQQYEELCKKNTNWNQEMIKYPLGYPTHSNLDTLVFRKGNQIKIIQDCIKIDILKNIFSGSRFHSLIVDVFLPFKAALEGKEYLFDYWFHWYCGDIPDHFLKTLQNLISNNKIPKTLSNGKAQALLQLFYKSGGRFIR